MDQGEIVTQKLREPAAGSFEESMRYYRRKALVHFARTIALHRIALTGGEKLSRTYDLALKDLLERDGIGEQKGRLVEDMTKQALANLKTDFEFFIYKMLWSLTYFDIEKLVIELQANPDEVEKSVNGFNKAFDLVWGSGFTGTEEERSELASIVLPDKSLDRMREYSSRIFGFKLLDSEALRPEIDQVLVAIEVRHKIEHTNGRIDSKFVCNCRNRLKSTSWGDRESDMKEVGNKVSISNKDVLATYSALVAVVNRLTNEIKRLPIG